MRTGSVHSIPLSHATKRKKCAKGTGSLITLNCVKGVNNGVTCISIFLVSLSLTVENQLAVLSTARSLKRIFPFSGMTQGYRLSSDPTQCACTSDMLKQLIYQCLHH